MNKPISIDIYKQMLEKRAVAWGKAAIYGMPVGLGAVMGGFLGRRQGVKKKIRSVQHLTSLQGARETSKRLHKQASLKQSLLFGGLVAGGALPAAHLAKKYYTKAPLNRWNEASARKKGYARGVRRAEYEHADASRPWREQM